MCLATMPYVYARLLFFSTGGKFQLVSSFTELHALTLAAHSYALLVEIISDEEHMHKHF